MTSASFAFKGTFALPLILATITAISALATETVKLDDGTTCTIIESTSSIGNGTSTSVTAGGGGVSSSTTIDGKTTTTQSGGGSASSSAGSSVTTGTAGNQAFSTASVTRPDGTVITRRSDGTCDITTPRK
ncbi:hypothetical protein DMC25_16050 [Caulobacter sp. D4A]|uniref:hypothetical protein n=1 Tax=Caulobacter sp. D4A TaxID=2204171 RepID=UPI000D737053|nr:hypothetical protein [Caulobacter sp. D4A]PXA85249.1 hypothetical protein DMC25_16050 [Caulobacter sp. D4A]